MRENREIMFWFGLILSFVSVLSLGCEVVESPFPGDSTDEATNVKADELQRKIDEALEFTLQNRQLASHLHGAWQVLHGVLAYQQGFPLQIGPNGESRSAVEYLLEGGEVTGWTFRPGTTFSDGTVGLRAIMDPGTKKGQGHADQWLAILAQCGLPAETKIRVAGRDFTVSDLILQVQYDVSSNGESEYSWTLIGLTLYLGTDAQWQAADGEEWSIERLVQIELDHDIHSSACGGTHRMIGMTMALNSHIADGGAIEGVWADVEQRIKEIVEIAKKTQNENGSFSSNYFSRAGTSADSATALSTTGHILEFLALALTEEQLREPWVARSANYMCDVFEELNPIAPECGALYHAAHGLVLYRQRVFGERRYERKPDESS